MHRLDIIVVSSMTASLGLPVCYISCPDDNNDFIEAIPPETRELVRKQQTSLVEERTADPGRGKLPYE